MLEGDVKPRRRLAFLVACTLAAALVTTAQAAASGGAERARTGSPQVDCGTMAPVHPRTGEPVRISAQLDGVEATLTGTYGAFYPSELTKPLLVVRDDGHVVLSEAVARGPDFFKDASALGSFPVYAKTANVSQSALCVVRLASGERPSVLLDLYSGGAHCCTILYGYRSGSPRHQLVIVDLGNPGAELALEGGKFVIVTANNSFAYAFSSFAGSGMPVEVLSFGGESFADVTGDYLGIVSEDANTWQSGYYEDPASATGLLAAWVADEDLLGRSASAWSFVESALRSGQMKVKPWFKSDAAYLEALRALLVKDGYQAS